MRFKTLYPNFNMRRIQRVLIDVFLENALLI